MVSALVSKSSGLGSHPGQGHCVVLLGMTIYSYSASTLTFKCALANLMLGEPSNGLAFHPRSASTLTFECALANLMLGEPSNGLAFHPGGE